MIKKKDSSKNKFLLIPKIENGIVIDHIPIGDGLKVFALISKLFPSLSNITASLGVNYPSTSMKLKDMIKLHYFTNNESSVTFPEQILQQISIICPNVSVKKILNFKVVKKIILSVPHTIHNLVKCKNPNCITNSESFFGETSFISCLPEKENQKQKMKIFFKCYHCENIFKLKELELFDFSF